MGSNKVFALENERVTFHTVRSVLGFSENNGCMANKNGSPKTPTHPICYIQEET